VILILFALENLSLVLRGHTRTRQQYAVLQLAFAIILNTALAMLRRAQMMKSNLLVPSAIKATSALMIQEKPSAMKHTSAMEEAGIVHLKSLLLNLLIVLDSIYSILSS